MNKLPSFRSTGVVLQEAGNELLIYDLQIDKAYNLNETSKIVYQACDGITTFDDLKKQHGFTDDLIFLAVDELKRLNLLENSADIPTHFAGLSRREAVKRVGFASMLAIPMITGLAAPTAAQTASGRCVGGGTTTNGNFVQSGGGNFCTQNQAGCDTVAANGSGTGGCCSGVATAVNNACDGGGTDPFSCQCVAP